MFTDNFFFQISFEKFVTFIDFHKHKITTETMKARYVRTLVFCSRSSFE